MAARGQLGRYCLYGRREKFCIEEREALGIRCGPRHTHVHRGLGCGCICGFTCGRGFARAFLIIFAIIPRTRAAGSTAFMIRFRRPGIIIERFSCRALSPSETHCSTDIGFMGMESGVRPSFAITGVSVGPGGKTVTCTPSGLSST
jgi:hypothetical protein